MQPTLVFLKSVAFFSYMKGLKIPKGQPESTKQTRTDNTTTKWANNDLL